MFAFSAPKSSQRAFKDSNNNNWFGSNGLDVVSLAFRFHDDKALGATSELTSVYNAGSTDYIRVLPT